MSKLLDSITAHPVRWTFIAFQGSWGITMATTAIVKLVA